MIMNPYIFIYTVESFYSCHEIYLQIDENGRVLNLPHQTSVPDTELAQLSGGYIKLFNVITGQFREIYLIKETNNVIKLQYVKLCRLETSP